MLYAGVVYNIEVKFEESLAPPCESSGDIRMTENPLEGVVISAYRRTISFEVWAEKKF